MTDFHKFYFKYTTIYYIIWISSFLIIGWYAKQLPAVDLCLQIDKKIPLIAQFVWLYLLCFVYPFLLLVITKNWHWYNVALLTSAFCTLMAYSIHLMIPIAFSKPELGTGISADVLAFIYRYDFKPGAQNLPSLHVSFSLIVYFAARKQHIRKVYEYIILLFSLLIILSTLLVKQHLFLDVIAGIALTVLVWYGIQLVYQKNINSESDPRLALATVIKKLRFYFILFSGAVIMITLLKLFPASG